MGFNFDAPYLPASDAGSVDTEDTEGDDVADTVVLDSDTPDVTDTDDSDTPSDPDTDTTVATDTGHEPDTGVLCGETFCPSGVCIQTALSPTCWSRAVTVADPSSSGDGIGTSVATDGVFVVAGGYNVAETAGYVFFYALSGGGWRQHSWYWVDDWQPTHFGDAVAVSGDVALVGARGQGVNIGAVYVYRFDGSDWYEETLLQSPTAAVGDVFGTSVAVSGDVALVGAVGAEDGHGSAYLYRYDRELASWSPEATLRVPAGEAIDEAFGASVALSGDVAVVGTTRHGAVYVYRHSDGGWALDGRLAPATERLTFGHTVSVDGDLIAVGDASDATAHVFHHTGTDWEEHALVQLALSEPSDRLSVAISGQRLLVGAELVSGAVGAVQLFNGGLVEWTAIADLGSVVPAGSSGFGASVALAGDIAVVGEPTYGDGAGRAHVVWTE